MRPGQEIRALLFREQTKDAVTDGEQLNDEVHSQDK